MSKNKTPMSGNAKGKGKPANQTGAKVTWQKAGGGRLLEDLRASVAVLDAEKETKAVKSKVSKVETVMSASAGPRLQFSSQRPGPKYKLYWAFGSNLDMEAMKFRCQAAVPFCAFPLDGVALVFRHVADVVGRRGSTTPGGLWWISPKCEEALDRYEGVSRNQKWGGLYEKRYVTLDLGGGRIEEALFYKMMRQGISPPSASYLETIERGYDDFGLDKAWLDKAARESWDRKDLTPYLRGRREREAKRNGGKLVLGRSVFGEDDTAQSEEAA